MNMFAILFYIFGVATLAYATYFNHSNKLLPSVGILTFTPFVICSFVILVLWLIDLEKLESDAPEQEQSMLQWNWGILYVCRFIMFGLFCWVLWEMAAGISRKPVVFWRRGIPTDYVDLISFGWWSRLIQDGDSDNLSPILEFISVVSAIVAGILLYEAKKVKKRMRDNFNEIIEDHNVFEDEDLEDLNQPSVPEDEEPMLKEEKPQETNYLDNINIQENDSDTEEVKDLKKALREKNEKPKDSKKCIIQ
jgi:Ca2+/Na+ antiporter